MIPKEAFFLFFIPVIGHKYVPRMACHSDWN